MANERQILEMIEDPIERVRRQIREVDARSLEQARVFRSWGRTRYLVRIGLGRLAPLIAAVLLLAGLWLFPNWDPPFLRESLPLPVRWIGVLLVLSGGLGLLAARRAWSAYERTWFAILDNELL